MVTIMDGVDDVIGMAVGADTEMEMETGIEALPVGAGGIEDMGIVRSIGATTMTRTMMARR